MAERQERGSSDRDDRWAREGQARARRSSFIADQYLRFRLVQMPRRDFILIIQAFESRDAHEERAWRMKQRSSQPGIRGGR
jgi:hypothetical protein